jgi:menaquinol-cytochrome c reductase iron-sulfur subunit
MTKADPTRRRMLSLCTMALLGILGALMGAPVLAFITSPLRRRGISKAADPAAAFADAGPLDAIPAGQWKLIPIEIVRQDGWTSSREGRSVWVRRADGCGAVSVRSPICTHLGCPITLAADGKQFRCPCHGATFDTDSGRRIAGPPPRDMDALDFEIRDGHLWIHWQDFQIGVAERMAVNV